MPNHVANRITFDCSDEKAKEILQSIMYDPKPDDEENTGPGTIDFGKLIPMPKSLMIEAGSTTTRGIEIYLTAVNPDTEDYDLPKMPKDKFDELVNALNGERIFYKYNPSLTEEEIRSATEYHSFGICADLGKQAITNFQNYGATTWYDWSVRNWGTKWNSYDPYKEDDRSLVFSTAWSAPHPVVEALSKKFPDVSFHHEWADEDIGYNCGRYFTMKHKGLIYTLVIVIGVIGIAAILIISSLGKRGNTPTDVSQTSEESAPHTSVPEVSESNPGTESSGSEINVIPVVSEPPFDPNDPIGNGDIAPDEIPDEDNKVTVVDGTVEDTKKEPSNPDTTVTDVKVKSDKKDPKKEKPDEVGYEVLNDNETEKKEEAKKQKAEKEKQEDKPATVVSVEKSKGTDDDKPVSLIDETENKSEDANQNGNAPVYVNPAKGGPNPFEGGGDTKIEDHDSSEFIGEGDDKPGEGIHF